MFETFSDKAVTNLIYCYRLAVPYKIMKVICESSYIKKCTYVRKWLQKTQTKMTMSVSTNPDTVMLWQGV